MGGERLIACATRPPAAMYTVLIFVKPVADKKVLEYESKYISGFRARQHVRSLAPVMNDE